MEEAMREGGDEDGRLERRAEPMPAEQDATAPERLGVPTTGPTQPPAAAEAEGQQSLAIDDHSTAAVAVAVPEEPSAPSADLPGATHVVTYGERDLDELVAELADSAPPLGEARRTSAHATQHEPAGRLTPTWPFLVYVGVWFAYAVALVLVMRKAASAGSIFASPNYVYFLYGGFGLAGAAVVLAIVVWLAERGRRPKGQRGGMLTSALLKGAVSLFIGTVVWWIAFYVLVELASSGR